MATGLFVLLDDIATILDDVAAMSKIAAKKTAGVLGDDLALNAEQVSGVSAKRELPVVWAVAKGSFLNKLILVPLALILSVVYPPIIAWLLIVGGLYLSYEGVEKVMHYFHKKDESHKKQLLDSKVDLLALEKSKIKGAIRTDFVLSAEIVIIVLGSISESSLIMKTIVLSFLSILFTVGIYGLVAVIVKMDDAGFYLQKQEPTLLKKLGYLLILLSPKLMRLLSIVGTIAMFLVGGGILAHYLPIISDLMHHLVSLTQNGFINAVISNVANAALSAISGFIVVLAVIAFLKLRKA